MKVKNDKIKQIEYNKITSILIAVQTWRILGIAFLFGVFGGILHPTFGITAGVGDILIGITAIPLAYTLIKKYTWCKYAILIWNMMGIADLLLAVSLGIITARENGISTMVTLPWVLIPTLGVPISLILHGLTLYRIRNTEILTR
jgi:hypothetical protein